jgi:hypothetical protein
MNPVDTETFNLKEAAQFLKIHPVTLSKKSSYR